MLKFFGAVGIEADRIAHAQEDGDTPEDLALWFGEKYGLRLKAEWGDN